MWAAEMASSRPDVDVVGIDLDEPNGNIKAFWTGRCRFISGVDFEDANWGLEDGTFDVVRCATLAGCVADWPGLLQRIKR